jgi:hypothetical protein
VDKVTPDQSSTEVPIDETGAGDIDPGNESSQVTIRPTTMPWLFGRYPFIDEKTMRSRLEAHGIPWNELYHITALRTYLSDRRARALNFVKYVTLLFLTCASLVLALSKAVGSNVGFGFLLMPWWLEWSAVFCSSFIVAALLVSLLRRRPGGVRRHLSPSNVARHRFFRRAGLVFDYSFNPIIVSNLIGESARLLFVALLNGRWTWASPPAVADRALRLAQPLIDVDVNVAFAVPESLLSFLYDVVIAVVAHREDMIPEIRANYPQIPRRSGKASAIDERDILYLDPMRNRGRWEIVQDFVLPLASWFSVVVSIAALVVAISR